MDAPTAPYVALLESDAVNNDDWITDHAGDPDLITWTNYTEGTEAIVITSVNSMTFAFNTGIKTSEIGEGITAEAKFGARGYVIVIQGTVDDYAAANKIDQFAMIDEHTLSTAEEYFLIVVQDTNKHKTFIDEDNNAKSYVRCWVIKGATAYTKGQARWACQLELKSAWR